MPPSCWPPARGSLTWKPSSGFATRTPVAMAETPQLETFAGEEEAKRTLAREILAENRLLYVRTIVRGMVVTLMDPGRLVFTRTFREPDNAQIGLTNTLSREGAFGYGAYSAARGPGAGGLCGRLHAVSGGVFAMGSLVGTWWLGRRYPLLVLMLVAAVLYLWDSGWSQRVCPVPFVPDAVHGGAGIGVVFAYIPPCYPTVIRNNGTALVALLREKGIRDERVLGAIRTIPRHTFVDSALWIRSYEDIALPIGLDQTISQPYTVARQTELLDLKAGQKVLEIGTGSGYQCAVLCELGLNVYSIERHRPLHERSRGASA